MAKQTDYEHDMKGFEAAKLLAVSLRTEGMKKRVVLQQAEDIYLMKWRNAPSSKEVKVVISPDGKNKTKGAVRLLTAASPHFKIPREKNDQDAEAKSSKLEQMAAAMWSMSNEIQDTKVERDMALCGFIYDEVIVNVVSMQDVVDNLQRAYDTATDKWEKPRWEGRLSQAKKNLAKTPYTFEIGNPMSSYPNYGRTGAENIYTETKRTVSDVRNHWGDRATKATEGMKDTVFVNECRMVDGVFEYVWLAENNKVPVFAEEHGVTVMPVVAVRAEGSRLFDNTRDQYDPFLKTLAESGLYEFQNRVLTAVNTNLSAMLNAQFVHRQGQPNDEIEIDHSKMLGVVKVPPGGSLEPLVKDVFSRDNMNALELTRGIVSESTIYDQALGAGAGNNDPYALVSLLSQGGRLPLSGVQDMIARACAKAMGIAFEWMKDNKGGKSQASYGRVMEIAPRDIPEVVRFEVDVEVDLPQDKLQQANIAGMLQKSELASDEWIQSNVLQIENPDQMATQILKEKGRKMLAGQVLQQVMQMAMQMTAPNEPPPPQEAPPMPQQQEQEMPVEGGLPPDMAGPMPPAPAGQPSQADMSGRMPVPPMPGGM